MNILLVIFYTLNDDRQKRIVEQIKSSHYWARLSPTAWCVRTENKVAEMRDNIMAICDGDDRVFVVEMTDSAWASYKIPSEVTEWLKKK